TPASRAGRTGGVPPPPRAGTAHPGGETPPLLILVNDPLDRLPAHPAEPDLVAREHDAVHLGAVKPARLVRRPLERADLPRVLLPAEELRLPLALGREERIHLRLRCVDRPQVRALLLHRAAVRLERLLL